MNRGRVILTTAFLGIVVILCFSRLILLNLGQDPLVCKYAY